MVHNGIEYGDMQLIAEVYDTLKLVVGMGNEEMADLFDEWNKTELSSYLIEITAKILRKKDDLTGKGYVVDYILDKTGQKVRCLCCCSHVLWATRQLAYAMPPVESLCVGNRSMDNSRSC
jgi:6-phosphogluconate dehydrogenase